MIIRFIEVKGNCNRAKWLEMSADGDFTHERLLGEIAHIVEHGGEIMTQGIDSKDALIFSMEGKVGGEEEEGGPGGGS